MLVYIYINNLVNLALTLWRSLQQRITKTSFNKAPLLANDAQKLLDVIAENRAIDPSLLQNLVIDYFEKARNFNSL